MSSCFTRREQQAFELRIIYCKRFTKLKSKRLFFVEIPYAPISHILHLVRKLLIYKVYLLSN